MNYLKVRLQIKYLIPICFRFQIWKGYKDVFIHMM